MADGNGPSEGEIRFVEERVTALERKTKALEKALARSASVSAYTAHALLSISAELQGEPHGLTHAPRTVHLLQILNERLADLVKAVEEAVDVG